jgi:hypothetical protein
MPSFSNGKAALVELEINRYMLRRINISAALIVLVCFFLPWEQVSCAGAKDNLSGLDLARHDQTLLWLVPLLMLAVIVVGALRRRNEQPLLPAIVSIVSGGITAFLMSNQWMRVRDASGLIAAQLTGWFWLSFLSVLAIVVSGFGLLFSRAREPKG